MTGASSLKIVYYYYYYYYYYCYYYYYYYCYYYHPQSLKRGIVKCLHDRAKRIITKPPGTAQEKNIYP